MKDLHPTIYFAYLNLHVAFEFHWVNKLAGTWPSSVVGDKTGKKIFVSHTTLIG